MLLQVLAILTFCGEKKNGLKLDNDDEAAKRLTLGWTDDVATLHCLICLPWPLICRDFQDCHFRKQLLFLYVLAEIMII